MTAARGVRLHVDLAAVRAHGSAAIAAALGFTLRGSTISPCPACGAVERSSRGVDRRGPVGLTRDGLGWSCHRCGARGDAIAFAALVSTGTATPDDWGPVFEQLERAGSSDAAPPPPPPTRPAATEANRPPPAEVLELWERSRPVVDDGACSAWLISRRLDPWRVADHDLARALPVGLAVGSWASIGGRSWGAAGYRCVFPLFDDNRKLLSLHARNLDRAAEPKGVNPSGHEVGGLVFADAVARSMLAHSVLDGDLWVVEGAPDFLTAATQWGDAADPMPATLGILSGSWTDKIATRVPNGAHVILAVHQDRAGERYIATITSTLGARVRFSRWVASRETG